MAAERYGYTPTKNGMIRCPFHADKRPSMKVDERYYCFGCGATGDAVDLTAAIFGLSPGQAVKKLISDFGLRGESKRSGRSSKKQAAVREAACKEKQRQDEITTACRIYMDFKIILKEIAKEKAPKDPQEEFDESFAAALHLLPIVDYYIEILLFGDQEDKECFIEEKREEVEILEKYCKNYWKRQHQHGIDEDGAAGGAEYRSDSRGDKLSGAKRPSDGQKQPGELSEDPADGSAA